MPYVNNIWLRRKRGDRPPVVPEGVTNLGLLGQYVELERDIAFTFEYSTRTAWEAIYRLLNRGPAPPDVYQGQFDLKGVWAATKLFLGLTKTWQPVGLKPFAQYSTDWECRYVAKVWAIAVSGNYVPKIRIFQLSPTGC
jgi:hypothetical protein